MPHKKQADILKAALEKKKLDHVTMSIGLLYCYDKIAKAQHGSSIVNQKCLEFYENIYTLIKDFKTMSKKDFEN